MTLHICRHAKESPVQSPIRSPVFSRTRKGSAATGRSPGFRVTMSSYLPSYPVARISSGVRGRHSPVTVAGTAPDFTGFPFHPVFTRHLLRGGRLGGVGCDVKSQTCKAFGISLEVPSPIQAIAFCAVVFEEAAAFGAVLLAEGVSSI